MRSLPPSLSNKFLASRAGLPQPPARPASQVELGSMNDVVALASRHRACVLLVGHGSKGQFKDPKSACAALDRLADRLDAQHGKGGWLVVFGGDPYQPDKPDIAHLVRYLRIARGAPALALQCRYVKDNWGGVDRDLEYVHYVPTAFVRGPDGKPTDQVQWGGFVDGKPVGPTAGYLGDAFLKSRPGGRRLLSEMALLGGGPIALAEAKYAAAQGIPLFYAPSPAKHPEVNGPYGAVDGWARSHARAI